MITPQTVADIETCARYVWHCTWHQDGEQHAAAVRVLEWCDAQCQSDTPNNATPPFQAGQTQQGETVDLSDNEYMDVTAQAGAY